jgi:hypothetical protein
MRRLCSIVDRLQQAPLTAEYQAKFEANLADQASGGQGTAETFVCLPNGMPRMMTAYDPRPGGFDGS